MCAVEIVLCHKQSGERVEKEEASPVAACKGPGVSYKDNPLISVLQVPAGGVVSEPGSPCVTLSQPWM